MNTFELHILTAEKSFFHGQCESLIVPSSDGMYGIQANHRNMVAAIVPGTMEYTPAGEGKKYAAISNGILKMEDNACTILADTAERPEDIDINRARRAAEEAKEKLLQEQSMSEHKSAEVRIRRELTRIKVSDQFGGR